MAFQQDPCASGQLSVKKRPLTSAEKQRNYRERLKQSPEKYKLFRQKEAERQRERTKTRQKTEEEIAYQRMKWRERVRKHRLKKQQEALMNERQFQDVFNMSEGSTSRLVVPEGFISTGEIATDVSFNQNTEYSQDNTRSCLEMNLSEMNIGQYVMEAHHDHNSGESSKLHCNTPEGDYDATHELNLEARSYFPAQQYLHMPSNNGFEVGQSQEYNDGRVTNVEELADQVPTGRTVLSLVEEFCGESSKKMRRKPLTPAERQRNYIARLKAQPEKWEQFKMRDIQRRKRLQKQNKMSEEVVSPWGKRQYQRRKREKGGSSSEGHMKETGQVGVYPLTGVPSHAAIEYTKTNAASHLAKNSSEVNVEQCDLELHATGKRFDCKDNRLKRECFTPDMGDNDIDTTVGRRDSFPAEKFVEMTSGNGLGVGQSPVHARGGQTYVEENQDGLLTNSSIVVLVGGSHRPSSKRRALTPAERQRKYRARLKAQPGKWGEYKSRDTERRRVTQKQNKSEEAAVWRRRKATERQREYRRRKKACADFPSTTNTETATSNTRVNQSNLDWNLSQVKVEQCDLDTYASDICKWKDNGVNVELECITPDMSHNYADATVAVRDHAHKETFGSVTSETECGIAQSDMCGDGSLTSVEEMQNHVPASPSVSVPVGDLPGQSSKRRKPLTPAERQRQYRARLKAQPDKWEQYKAKDAERRKRTQEQKRMSEAAALQRRIKARERQRAYRRKKREKEKSVFISQMKEMGQADVWPVLEESSNPADISSRTTGGTGNVKTTGNNQNRYRSVDFLQNTSDSQLDMNSSDPNIGQYAMEEYAASNNVAKPECDTSSYGDNATHQVKLEVRDDFPVKHVVSPTSLICKDSGQDQLLRVPSVSSLVEDRPRRLPKRRRTMTAAERQRNYRARRKAQLEMEEQQKSKDTEGPKNVQEQEKVSEDATSHLRKKAAERTQVHRFRKREVAGLNIGRYAMEEYAASNDVAKPECDTSSYGDNATHQVKLEVSDDFPVKHVVGPTSLVCKDSGQDQLLRVPSVSSPVADRPRRSPKRRRTMTAAERQRNYRARRKAQLEMEEQQKSKDTEGPKNVQEQEKVSEDATSHLRKKAAERTQVHRFRKREVAGLNIGQYAMEEYAASNNVAKPECDTSSYGDNATHQVKLEVRDDFPVKHVVGPTSLICKDSGQDQLLRVPSVSSPVADRPRRSPKRRRTMTAAERQHNYRARRKAQLEMEEQQKSKDTEGPKNVQEQEKVSEDATSHLRKKAAERTQVHRFRKGEVAGLNTHGSSKGTSQTNVCPMTMDPHFTRTTRSTIAARRQQNRRVKQKTTAVVEEAEQRDERIRSSTERLELHTEAQLAYKRMKGRERMRKYRLRQKQKLKNACEGFEENDMPKITAVWSMSEEYEHGAQMRQENNTEYSTSKFDKSVPVCNLNNLPKRNTMMLVDDLAKIVPQDDIESFYSSDSNPFFAYPMGSANALAYSDIPTALASHTPQPNSSEEQGRGAFEGNEIQFKTNKLTSAERQRKYRERLQQNPEKWAAYKQKANERYMARKKIMTMKDIEKKRRQSLLRTRRWRAKLKESKDSRDNTLDDALDNFQNGISEGETHVSDLSYCDEKSMHYITRISEKLVGLKGVTSLGQRGKKKRNKTPEEIERLRQANRERQRRHRAKKRGQLEQSVQSTISFAEKTEPLVLADCIATNRIEKSESTLREGKLTGGLIHSQDPVESEIHCSSQFRICPNLSPSELVGPRKWGRSQINQITKQPTTQVRKRRGRPPKQSPLKTEQCTNPAINDTMVSPLGNGCHGEVLVSSAGNIPMVIKTPEVKGQQDHEWEEIPQVIPCDPPPEANFDWGNVDLDRFEPALDGEVPLGKVEVTEPVPREGEGGCISGSARRKAFFPTKHDTADLTLNAAWAVETSSGNQ